jgi:hypothetical protein
MGERSIWFETNTTPSAIATHSNASTTTPDMDRKRFASFNQEVYIRVWRSLLLHPHATDRLDILQQSW